MEYRILGPPEVATASGPVRLAGQRQCMVLAVLLANAHQVVSIDHLVDALWEERPPATARRQVRNCVSALGRALGDRAASEPAIVAVSSGYRIRPRPGELDAQVFADGVAAGMLNADAGQVLAAVAQLRSALGLWRGPALAGLTGRVAEATAAGLEELRYAALERCLGLELSLGRHAELVGELTEFVAANPLRERLVSPCRSCIAQYSPTIQRSARPRGSRQPSPRRGPCIGTAWRRPREAASEGRASPLHHRRTVTPWRSKGCAGRKVWRRWAGSSTPHRRT